MLQDNKVINFPIQQGLTAPRCHVLYFDHNDPISFIRETEKVAGKERNKKPTRNFLIVEGVSWKTSKILLLMEFLKIGEDLKMRVFLEETYSVGIFGVLLNTSISIGATLGAAIGSIGGFCAGFQTTIEHQRLSSSGYAFSASFPADLV